MPTIFPFLRRKRDTVPGFTWTGALLLALAAIQPAAILVGWIFRIPFLRGNGDPSYAFAPLTASLFLLIWTGAAAALSGGVRLARTILALPATLLMLVLADTVFGIETGLNHLLFPQQVQEHAVVNGGMTGTGAALVLIMLWFSGYFLTSSGPFWRSGAVLAASAAVSLALLTTSIVIVDPPEAIAERFIGSSILSSLPVFALGSAVIIHSSRDQRGLESASPWRLLRRVAPAIIILPAIPSILSFAGYRTGVLGLNEAQFIVLAGTVTIIAALLFYTLKQSALQNRALELREHQLQAVLDSVPDAVLVINREGQIIDFSPAAERLWGYKAEETIGQDVTMLAPSRDRLTYERYIALQRFDVKGSAPRHVTAAGLRSNGTEVPLEIRIGYAEGSDIDFIPVFCRDLTEQLIAEDHSAQLGMELEFLARQTAMGEIAADLAHELNQPLAAASNYLAAASFRGKAIADNEEGVQLMHEARKQIQRAGEIIRRMRSFTERNEIERRNWKLDGLIDEASSLVLVGSGRLGVQIDTQIDPSGLTAFVDRIQIQQVIVNLMRNAVEAVRSTGQSDVRVFVSARPVSDTMIEIAVRDNGPGLSGDTLDRLFTRFSGTKGLSEGMGLGLSISKRIVEAHEGRIAAGNHPEGGAYFRFTVPRAASAHSA